MVEYKCNLCNKIFNKKSTFIDHQLRKRPCNKNIIINNHDIISDRSLITNKSLVISDGLDINLYNDKNSQTIKDVNYNNINKKINIITKSEDLRCKKCNVVFTIKTNLYRHMRKTCYKKDDKNNIILQKIDEIINRQNKLELSLVKNNTLDDNNNNNNNNNKVNKKKYIENTNSNNIINNNSNNIINNINICSLGSEDISKLSSKVLRSMYVCDNDKLFLNSIEGINFNPDLPQNHNISYRNLRSNDCLVYDDNKWSTMDIKEVIKMLLSSHSYYLKRIILENNNLKLSKYIKDNILLELIKYNRTIVKQDEIDRVMEDLNITVLDDIEVCHEKIYNSFKRLLYDKTKELNIKSK